MSLALEIKGLKKVYAAPPGKGGVPVEALKNVDLSVEEGDFFALLGPNGDRKSVV